MKTLKNTTSCEILSMKFLLGQSAVDFNQYLYVYIKVRKLIVCVVYCDSLKRGNT